MAIELRIRRRPVPPARTYALPVGGASMREIGEDYWVDPRATHWSYLRDDRISSPVADDRRLNQGEGKPATPHELTEADVA